VLSDKDFDYNKLKNKGTGSHEVPKDYKIIDCPFDRYLVTIKLTPDNEFVEIVEVKVNKDFLSYKQKMPPKGFHDVEEFYREE